MNKMKIKILAATIMSLVFLNTFAADNSIYIDQAGDNAVISITQDGAGNIVRGLPGVGTSSTTPAIIYGDNNQVTVSQVGSGNTLRLGIDTTTGGVGNPVINYSITGSNASATISSMKTGATNDSPQISVVQDGNFSSATVIQSGAGTNNSVNVTTAGVTYNAVTVNQTSDTTALATVDISGGGSNTVGITQTAGSNTASVTIAGASNTVTATQTGDHALSASFTGSGNTATFSQTGLPVSNIANVVSSGSGNTFTVTQTAR